MKIEDDKDPSRTVPFHFLQLAQITHQKHGAGQYQLHSYTIRDDDGIPIAGLCGYSVFDFAVLDVIWVDPAHRLKKLGQMLLRRFELAAAKAGSQRILLSTVSVHEAMGFWLKMGFEIVAQIEDCPRGGYTAYLQKRR